MSPRKKGHKARTVLIVFLLISAVLLLLMSPLFTLSEIDVSGNERLSKQQIMDISGIIPGMNIFRFSSTKAEKALLNDNYIKNAAVSVKLPNTASIEVVERKPCGYIPYMGAYLFIDADGYILENSSQLSESCPIVSGLRFSEFTIGQQLKVENTESFDIVMTMSKVLMNYDFLDEIKEMNIAAPDNIHLYINNVDVSFGDITDADKKVRFIIEIIKKLDKGDKGVLHIEDLKNTPYFSYTL